MKRNILEHCELYIDRHTHIVAYVDMYKLGPTIHNQILNNNNMVRLVVIKVQNANAQVPKPIDEVTAVGQAPYNFIQWPKRLLQLVSNKAIEVSKKDDIPSKRLNFQLNYVEQLMSENDPTYPQVHIQKKMYEDKRNCYLAPYLKK
ncbi:uncharacterized protein [Cicer arietinum]|uniref:uncharacterized protein n=1 Tax=Cicer arietinum TaxID=3827 RepID=UPI003CC65004